MKRMYNTFEEFEQLPQEVKNKIIRDLAAYDETHVFFEHGKYDVSVDWCLRASTAAITVLSESGAIKIYLKGCRSLKKPVRII
jgi:hypothetical protein